MTFAEALDYAKRMNEDVNVMEDSDGDFHVIRLFGVDHWLKHYRTVTEVRMIQQITGRQEGERDRLRALLRDAARLYGTKEALDALRDRKTLESERAAWEKRAMEAEADWRRLRAALAGLKDLTCGECVPCNRINAEIDKALSGEP